MKRLNESILIAAVIASFAGCVANHENPTLLQNTDSIKKTILDINDKMLATYEDAAHGAEKYISFCADSMIANNGGDFSISPAEVSHDLASGTNIPPHDFTFRLYDKTAILSFLKTSYELINTDTLYHHFRVTETFVNIQGKWKVAAMIDALQPVNYFKRLPDKKPEVYRSLAGIYQWKRNVADTLFEKAGKLYDAETGSSPQLNFPVNDSEFMVKNDLGRVMFNKDAKGKVSSYTYTREDGQKIHAIKLQ